MMTQEGKKRHQHQGGGGGTRLGDEWIKLNVGGKIFATTRTTLCSNEPNSMLARMFSQSQHNSHNSSQAGSSSLRPSPRDAQGAYLIDRSPRYFEPILNYLRHGKLIMDHHLNVQGVLEEAKFFGIATLIPQLELEAERWLTNGEAAQQKQQQQPLQQQQTMPPLTRLDVVKAIVQTTSNQRGLRFQGCNLAGADLSKLDLRHINFRYANLRNCNLKGANLSGADFERADMFQSNLEGTQVIGTNLAFANLENSNLRAITVMPDDGLDALHSFSLFQQHNRSNLRVSADQQELQQLQQQVIYPQNESTRASLYPRANFECANLRNTNLEGSRLAEANMRMAILKGSNLQNCDLTRAILTGADLENCDLSGSNLNEANLRKTNVKGAQFELEVL